MSFVREALALTVLEALCPATAVTSGEGFTTNAGGRVFLEKVDALDDLAVGHRAAVITIYTNTDDGQRLSVGEYGRVIEVEIVISMVSCLEAEDGAAFFNVPITDRELFSALNVAEAQVRAALLFGASGLLFRKVAKKIATIRSEPVRDAEEGFKLAERRLTLSCEVPDDCLAPASAEGTARLPDPLRTVADALMTAGYQAEIAAAIAQAAPVQSAPVPFTGITLDIDISQPSDGTVDITAEVAIPQ
ncbi:hypothetical protein [Xanthobacter sp. 91]|uniref:hypothetical protein n=1 Tax=Xanthobacter sp. 91 TaxID=1117244 RepID=UPI000495806E|nr:hypothetical protein [Xanthobacter sp. 91]